LTDVAPGDHFLVADDGGEIAGFAYSAAYRSRGFEHAGTLREVGRKFDRRLDTAWYQKIW
jgi:L-amino acid N-acyltransferase YncA